MTPVGRPLHARIDLAAFQHNIQVSCKLAPGSQVLVIVKANAYGHGLIEMAQAAGVHDLGVAIPEELHRLIDAGLKNKVWVLEGPFSQQCIEAAKNHAVVWVIHSLWQLNLFEGLRPGKRHQICLKVDTGMNRLGFSNELFTVALKRAREIPCLELAACMTHFSSSDLNGGRSVEKQVRQFDQIVGSLQVNCSLANSGGVLLYPGTHRDMVRPGIMLYGGMPDFQLNAIDYDLKPVMSFRSAIIALKKVPVGQSVGYGSNWTAEVDSVVATVAGGYGDGYPRHAVNGTPVGVFKLGDSEPTIVPLVGTVSMDMLSVDVTELPGVQVGDAVELWGNSVSVDLLASKSGTIGYDLLCAVTTRVPRYYL